jgi:hypothetical protein
MIWFASLDAVKEHSIGNNAIDPLGKIAKFMPLPFIHTLR